MTPGPDYIEPVGALEYPDLFVFYEYFDDAIKTIRKHLDLQDAIKQNKSMNDQAIHILTVFECVRRNIHFFSDIKKMMNVICERLESLKNDLKQYNEPLFTFYESFFHQFLE
jgi:hypothetical protein